jgi:hypothetical protein
MAESPIFLSLLAHPQTPCEAVRSIAACVEAVGPDSLRLEYVLEADFRHVRTPPPVANAGRADKLWAHTCFEAFVWPAGTAGYLELNFSPSGEWAAYRFESYRRGMAPAFPDRVPRLNVRGSAERLELQAQVNLSGGLPVAGASVSSGMPGEGRMRIAVSTIVEDQEGRLSYWALRHPPGKPDFHRPESFALAIELPRTTGL